MRALFQILIASPHPARREDDDRHIHGDGELGKKSERSEADAERESFRGRRAPGAG
jgi:hypothetical protein